ncbi:MAG: calcium-binding protein [Nostoc sp.]|uniref:beta strand repeat-containing protein n=1 Tax=Nostoc sp. TaxID=1180 RepID=UPI002FF5B6F2
MANIIGTNGNDTLLGSNGVDTIKGLAGNDIITGNEGNDSLTGGGGKDNFVYKLGDGTDTITDFGGIGKGTNPTVAAIAEVDTIKFQGAGLTARNLLLTKNLNNLEITFEGINDTKIILQNFTLEKLENLAVSGKRPAIGNILFDGQTSIFDSFNVLDGNSTDTSVGIKNTVTFFNGLSNNITGLDNSDDVINSQDGDDKIDGLSGNDILRGGAGNDTLIGSAGNDTLIGSGGNDTLIGGALNDAFPGSVGTGIPQSYKGNDSLVAGTGNDILNVNFSEGNNTLEGSAGNDSLSAGASKGNNLLNGDDGNDFLSASYLDDNSGGLGVVTSSGNNTLNGGAGNDSLSTKASKGDNLLDGGDGNDFLDASGDDDRFTFFVSPSNNTLIGGAGDDNLSAGISSGDNLLDGGDGNDSLDASGTEAYGLVPSSGNNTLNGGAGNDYLSATRSIANNLLSGGQGNDSIYISTISPDSVPDFSVTDLVTQTVDGGTGNDLLSCYAGSYYLYNPIEGITSTFNATNNTGSITVGTNRISYKNIERLDISGTQFNDLIVGSNGNDILTGGNGNDSLYGGAGTDTFVFNSFNQGTDRLYDFNPANEVIQVSATDFGGSLSSGSLKTSQFTIGTSATNNTQRFIYNSATGGLFFDLDGSASGFTQVQFAQLDGGALLTKNNFVVV